MVRHCAESRLCERSNKAVRHWWGSLPSRKKRLLCVLLFVGLGILVLALVGCDGLLPCCW